MKVSVCLACFNGEKYIYTQISSILVQLKEQDELIISDDHSNDSTLEIIKSINDKRIKLFSNDRANKGHAQNFNNALSKVTGDIIFLSDQDDYWLSSKIEIMSNYLKYYDIVVSNCYLTDENLNIIRTFYSKSVNKLNKFIPIWSFFSSHNWLGCCMAFNRKTLNQIYPIPNRIYAHDVWILNFGSILGKTIFIDDPLLYLRRHLSNTSIKNNEDVVLTGLSQNSYAKRIAFRLTILSNIIKRLTNIPFK